MKPNSSPLVRQKSITLISSCASLISLILFCIVIYQSFLSNLNPITIISSDSSFLTNPPKIEKEEKIEKAENIEKIVINSPLYSKSLKSHLYSKEFPYRPADSTKAEAVKEAFLHAFHGYSNTCWGQDEIQPISNTCKNTLGAGLTIVDSLTTLYIMNLTDEYQKAREFVANDFRPNGSWSLFEFIIRFIGGFISIYQLTNDKLYLDKAVECADAVFPLFDSETGFYTSNFVLETGSDGKMKAKKRSSASPLLAEVGTYQIEFLTLTALTGDMKYMNLALQVYKTIWANNPDQVLISEVSRPLRNVGNHALHVGAGTDSYFEYIIKSYILTGGVSKKILSQHNRLMKEIRKLLIFKTKNLKLTGIGVKTENRLDPTLEHLATFIAGTFAVGTVKGNSHSESDLKLASELVLTFANVTRTMKSKLMPERVLFNLDDASKPDFSLQNDQYMLRPETVESIFYMYRFTGEQQYRDIAWDFFKGINTSCRVKNGFVTVRGLDSKIVPVDIMESFFLAETLNYLYLTFADTRLISPVEWVFNTESHPLHVWPKDIIKKYEKDIQFEGI
ncbi:Mannosyl-oligosaccharide 1,2-alpha-mannosidase MNS2 [Tritrichomonas foetus]|uniref:alpha-1,2-Mannosidase n=1 Tax=Tritrichomonas foetus TaxID=1144522 RepID=A0A1J4J5A2_9EUKA|nr:Mannosyl-oligosaccharide 1,2-alpha-mannosidase MNS2 [Tritrichomonas foetus]|eukprot:OHS94442.1 Mannosyl-oligosaccharide 1,2-alpha-mannosidase MNS2 [Tritrichomonas foetus]